MAWRQQVRLAIFDWDGTLMDSVARIVACVYGVARDCGYPIPDEEEAKRIIGLSLSTGLAHLFDDDEHSAQTARLVERYRHHWLHDPTPSPLFDGASELLHAWHRQGILLAVATGKSRAGLDRVLDDTGLRPLFAASRGADEAHSKPDPLMLTQLLDELAIPLEQAVMIGDSVHDLGMAAKLGMKRIGVTWGVDSRARLAHFSPVALVDSMAELQRTLG